MTARAVRSVVLVVCGLGIAGMIVTSILGHNGAAVAFGLVTAAAVLCSMVATAVANGTPAAASSGAARGAGAVDERQAALVEDLIQELVAGGADEDEVRRLVQQAVRLGRGGAGL